MIIPKHRTSLRLATIRRLLNALNYFYRTRLDQYLAARDTIGPDPDARKKLLELGRARRELEGYYLGLKDKSVRRRVENTILKGLTKPEKRAFLRRMRSKKSPDSLITDN